MDDIQNSEQVEEIVIENVAAIIDGSAADEPARGNLNGSDFEYARNVEHLMPEPHYQIIENAGFPIRLLDEVAVSSPESVLTGDGAAPSETQVSEQGDGGAPVEGGTGSTVIQETDLTILDKKVEEVVAALPNLSKADLEALLAAENAGKTRVTVIAALEAAIAGPAE